MQIKFEWTPEISVNDEIIDNQHKKLFNKINFLLEEVSKKDKKERIGETIEFLGNYIEEHLKYEEQYMKKHSYPELKEHTKIHNQFIKKYEEFKEKFKKNPISDTLFFEIETFLGEWWLKHIKVDDKKYAVFIEENEL